MPAIVEPRADGLSRIWVCLHIRYFDRTTAAYNGVLRRLGSSGTFQQPLGLGHGQTVTGKSHSNLIWNWYRYYLVRYCILSTCRGR